MSVKTWWGGPKRYYKKYNYKDQSPMLQTMEIKRKNCNNNTDQKIIKSFIN